MSGNFYLDWATQAASLFNALLLLWLGLTVLLNAEPHTLGIWLAGAGLLTGAAFFMIHSVILGLGFGFIFQPSNFWWYAGWIPVILAPFAWYVVMLWYTGFWEAKSSPIYRRHRIWLGLLLLGAGAMVGMFVFSNPLPSFGALAHLELSANPAVFGVPLLILVYPLFILACILLSLDALLRPGPTVRMMGQIARQRARPWLAAATGMLLLVSLMVAGFIGWLAIDARRYTPSLGLAQAVGWLDLVISGTITGSILLTGQAIVSYEVFTGKALPRRGLRRQWLWVLAFGAGLSLLIGLMVSLDLPPIYSVVPGAGLIALLLAVLSRRSYRERQDFIAALRPFIASQQLYEQVLSSPDEPAGREVETAFRGLCEQVLGTQSAILSPVGALAPMFGPPLAYPEAAPTPATLSLDFLAGVQPDTLCFQTKLAPEEESRWAIPLWNARGLCGVLLLAEKLEGGLYSQEEMELARTTGERLMDLQTSAGITRRLMALQRRQLAESQVLDRQARRVLHDEALPRLHAVLLELSAAGLPNPSPDTLQALSEAHRLISGLLYDLPAPSAPRVQRDGLFPALQQAVEDEFSGVFDRVDWEIDPGIQERLKSLPALQAEVAFYATREAIRNAALHARPDECNGPLHLEVHIGGGQGLEIIVQDNGVGIGQARLEGKQGGRGLELHSTLLAVIGGALEVESESGEFTRVRITLPGWD